VTRHSASRPDHGGGKAETQARILRAAISLFAERGYERTTIAAIAAEAGVSRAAIFWHFGDKATLFQETLRELLVPFVREVERSVERADPRDRVLALFAIYEEFVEKHRDTIESFVRWVLESPGLRSSLQEQLFAFHDVFVRDLREALEDSVVDAEEGAALTAALVALLDGSVLLSFLDPDAGARQLRRDGLRRITGLLLERRSAR
jgi:AcrR family transcriptional regulator